MGPLVGAGQWVTQLSHGHLAITRCTAGDALQADPQGTHWYQDLQLLTDVITCHGVPGRQQPVAGR